MPKPAKHALVVLASPELVVAKDGIKNLAATAVAQCRAVGELESKAAAGAILAGLTLHRVKASLPHGKFGGFIEQKLAAANFWTPATAKLNASFYMRLGLVFVEKARTDKAALLALPSDGGTLALGETAGAKKLAAALEKFVGELSLTELLIKHGIKGVGMKTALDAEVAAEEGAPAPTTAQQAEQTWAEAWTSVQAIHATVNDPSKLQLLTDAKQLELLKAEIVEINQKLSDRLKTLRAK